MIYIKNGKEVSREEWLGQDGKSRVEEMLKSGKVPYLKTDVEFLRGHCNGNQFEDYPQLGEAYRSIAERQGQNTKGKIYLSGLADSAGDPRAWVEGRAEAKRLIEERGWGCQGTFNVPMKRIAEPLGGGLAKDLLDEYTAQEVMARGGPRECDVSSVREEVYQQHRNPRVDQIVEV